MKRKAEKKYRFSHGVFGHNLHKELGLRISENKVFKFTHDPTSIN